MIIHLFLQRYPVLATILVLALAEYSCLAWNSFIQSKNAGHLLTQIVPFLLVDSLCIQILDIYRVLRLTNWIKICLYLSIIAHVFGAFCWVSGSPLLDIYDQIKDYIFYLEIMAFIAYGFFRGGRKLRTMANSSILDGIFSVSRGSRDYKSTQGATEK